MASQVLAGRLTVGTCRPVQYVWQINQPIQNLTQLVDSYKVPSQISRIGIFQVMDEPDEVADVTETSLEI